MQKNLSIIRNLIKKGKTDSAIQKLMELLKNSKMLDELILQSARHEDIKNELRLGTLEFEDASISKNKIRKALLDIIGEIDEAINKNNDLDANIEKELNRNNNKEDQGRTINQTGKYNAGRDINVGTVNNILFKGFSKLLPFLALLSLGLVYGSQGWKSLSFDFQNWSSSFDSKDSLNLKLIFFPPKPDIDNKNIDVAYNRKLIERFDSKKQEERLGISLLPLKGNKYHHLNEDEIIDLAKKKKADVVIWPSYEEDADGKMKFQFRYNLLKDILIKQQFEEGDSGMQPLKSLDLLKKGYLQDSVDYVIYWIEGLSIYKEKKLKKAISVWDKIVTNLKINDPNVYAWIAHSYGVLQEYEKAKEAFNCAIEYNTLKKGNCCYYANRGLCNGHLANHEQALDDYNTSMLLGHKDPDMYINKANALKNLNRVHEAIEILEEAAEIHPFESSIYYNKSIYEIGLVKYRDAIESLTHVINSYKIKSAPSQYNPSKYGLINNRGCLYIETKDYDKALQDFIEALRLAPNEKPVQTNKQLAESYVNNHVLDIYEDFFKKESPELSRHGIIQIDNFIEKVNKNRPLHFRIYNFYENTSVNSESKLHKERINSTKVYSSTKINNSIKLVQQLDTGKGVFNLAKKRILLRVLSSK